jgi:hypothetical protein
MKKQGESFFQMVESLNDGGWTVLWDQVTDESGKATVRFAQYWNHGGKRCETIDLDSQVTLEELFGWQWDTVFIENGENLVDSLHAATTLAPQWWESMVANNDFKVLHYCCTIVILLLHCCYTVVTLLLHCCYTVVTLLLYFYARTYSHTLCSYTSRHMTTAACGLS